ncbi:hypothetical protein ACU4GD_02335 [Cupriavidus basilensis]
MLLEQALSLSGHDSVRFREGGALMQALRNERHDLLLMAWEIPGIRGTGHVAVDAAAPSATNCRSCC